MRFISHPYTTHFPIFPAHTTSYFCIPPAHTNSCFTPILPHIPLYFLPILPHIFPYFPPTLPYSSKFLYFLIFPAVYLLEVGVLFPPKISLVIILIFLAVTSSLEVPEGKCRWSFSMTVIKSQLLF